MPLGLLQEAEVSARIFPHCYIFPLHACAPPPRLTATRMPLTPICKCHAKCTRRRLAMFTHRRNVKDTRLFKSLKFRASSTHQQFQRFVSVPATKWVKEENFIFLV